MEYTNLVVDVLEAVGGVDNVKTVTHCITRLRVACYDTSKINKDHIKSIEGVQGLVDRGYEMQIIIGTDVVDVYNAFNRLVASERKAKEAVNPSAAPMKDTNKKKSPLDIFLKYVGGSVISTFPILCCAASISVVSMVLVMFCGISSESGTYIVFNTIFSTFFDFMPIFIGFGAAKIVGINSLYGAFLGAYLVHGNINGVAGLDIFGIDVPTASYGSTVFPVLLGVAFMALIDKYIGSKMPQSVTFLLRPFVVIGFSIPITLWVLGPLGTFIGIYIAQAVQWIHESFGAIAVVIMAFISPLLAATGTGNALLPIFLQSFIANGYEAFMFPTALAQNLAIGGAVLAVALKTKSRARRQRAVSSGVTALCGITEPALFGIALPLKKTFLAVLAGSTCGGIVSGIMDVKMFGVNPPGLVTLPLFMNPDGTWGNMIGAILIVVVSFAVAFAVAYFLGFEEDPEAEVNFDNK